MECKLWCPFPLFCCMPDHPETRWLKTRIIYCVLYFCGLAGRFFCFSWCQLDSPHSSTSQAPRVNLQFISLFNLRMLLDEGSLCSLLPVATTSASGLPFGALAEMEGLQDRISLVWNCRGLKLFNPTPSLLPAPWEPGCLFLRHSHLLRSSWATLITHGWLSLSSSFFFFFLATFFSNFSFYFVFYFGLAQYYWVQDSFSCSPSQEADK